MKQVMLGIAAALAIGTGEAQAQRFGVQLNYGTDSDFGIGGRLELGLPNLVTSTGPLANTFLIGSFDYFFIDCNECTYWELNGNLAIPITASTVDPYVGAGLNIGRFSVDASGLGGSNTDLGVNLLGGLRFALGGLSAFGEGRLELGGGEQFVLTFGVLVGGKR